MRIKYDKLNLMILFICAVTTLGLLVGVKNFYLDPIQMAHINAKNQLSSVQNQYEITSNLKDQLNDLVGDSFIIQDVTTQIPVGNIQPKSLLATFSDKAKLANVIILEQRFQEEVPFVASTEETEEELQPPFLMKSMVTLKLQGDNADQFRKFIELLEGADRLIQVEAFTVEQTLTINDVVTSNEITHIVAPVTYEGIQSIDHLTQSQESVVRLSGSTEKASSSDSQSGRGSEKEDGENSGTDNEASSSIDSQSGHGSEKEGDENSETDNEADSLEEPSSESVQSPSAQQVTMRANLTVAVYYFES